MVECGNEEGGISWSEKSTTAWHHVPSRELTTVQIHFKMDSALREHRRGSGGNVVEHEAGAIFGQHARSERAVDGDVNLCGTRMGVWNIHAAGFHVPIG